MALQVNDPLKGILQQATTGNIMQSVPKLNPQPVQAPVVGPAKPVTAPKPAAVRTVAPVPAQQPVQPVQVQPQPVFAQPQTFQFMDQKPVQVDQFGQVMNPPAQQPQQPAVPPTPTDPYAELAKKAGAAGMSTGDLAAVLGLSPEERDKIYNDLGLTDLEKTAFSAPTKSTEQLYNDAYSAAGLAEIKSKFQNLQDTINKKAQELTAAVGKVNENPWLSEASRVGRAKRVQELAQAEISNLVSQAQQYADLYNQGLEEVNGVVSRSTQDFTNNQTLNQAKLQYLEGKAGQQIQDATAAKLARYLPDYLSSIEDTAAPKTITLEDGSVLAWNPTSKTFESVYKGTNSKNLPVSAQEYQYALANGYQGSYTDYQNEDANRKRPVTNVYAGGGATGISGATLTKVQTIANQFDGEQIVKDFNVIAGKAQSVQQILQGKLGGPGDLAVVYEFMKGLDPTSVVRETEYASAAKSGNIFAGAFAKFNGYLKPNGGFLPDSVKQSFLSILNTKLNTAKSQYDNLYNEYGRRIDKITGGSDGTDYITNYGAAFGSSSPSASTQEAINKYVP